MQNRSLTRQSDSLIFTLTFPAHETYSEGITQKSKDMQAPTGTPTHKDISAMLHRFYSVLATVNNTRPDSIFELLKYEGGVV